MQPVGLCQGLGSITWCSWITLILPAQLLLLQSGQKNRHSPSKTARTSPHCHPTALPALSLDLGLLIILFLF